MTIDCEPSPYLTTKEVCFLLRVSRDTLRRRMIAGKLTAINWVDFFNDGKLRATRESVEAFIQDRHSETKKVYAKPLKKSRRL